MHVLCYQYPVFADAFSRYASYPWEGKISDAKTINGTPYVIVVDIKPCLPKDTQNVISLPDKSKEEEEPEDTNTDMFHGPSKTWIDKEEWDSLTKDGCCICSDPLEEKESHLIGWTENENPLCPVCFHVVSSDPDKNPDIILERTFH